MKKLLIILSVVGCLLADSPVGNWKLSGLAVDYLHLTRENAIVNLTDTYWEASGLPGPMVTVPVMDIPNGAVYQRFTNGPFTLATIDAAQLNLNVNLYPDGSGAIADGSFYPDIDLIPGTCITSPQIFPVTDTFIWESGSGDYQFATTNILGLNSINSMQGTTAFGLGIAESGTFDGWPANPTPEALAPVLDMVATTDGTVYAASCQTAVVGQACGAAGFDPATQVDECVAALTAAGQYDGVVAQITACEMDTNPAYGGTYAGSANWGGAGWLQGSHSSGFMKRDAGNSQMGQDINVDFLLEWNAIDGATSGSGLGDEIGVDEDGDGTDFDRIFGLPAIPSTTTTPDCPLAPGLTYPIAGDLTGEVAALVTGQCIEGVEATLVGTCELAGGPAPTVAGLCTEAALGDDFAAACSAAGAAQAVVGTCLQLGFPESDCADGGLLASAGVADYCLSVDADGDGAPNGLTCEQLGVDECTVLTDADFASFLCSGLAATLVDSETCTEWGDTFDPAWLDANGAAADFDEDGTPDGVTCTDLGLATEAGCIASAGDLANDMYLMDPTIGATWGFFLTMNSASVQQYLAGGFTVEQLMLTNPELFVNDSGWDFNPSEHYSGMDMNGDGNIYGGRLVMTFEPLCIEELEARQVVAEFVNLDNLCSNTGDANQDGTVNVVDVVQVVSHVLSTEGTLDAVGRCEADSNGDGVVNVVDIVLLVNGILGGSASAHNAQTDAVIEYSNKSINITEGTVQGIEFTISHCEDFSIELNSALNSDYAQVNTISDTETKVVAFTEGAVIRDLAKITTSCEYTISDIVVASQHGTELKATTKEIVSKGYAVKPAYPNPFNPSTNINLTLDMDANISVKVYNVTGQLVDVVAEGFYSPSSYKWTWNAENLASGVYFVKTQVGTDIHTEKIMLLK